MIKLGSNSIGKIYLGSNSIGKAYLGSNLVFQSGGVTPGRLPSGYTEIEYIENPSTARIDTGISGVSSWSFTAQLTGTISGNACVFGSSTTGGHFFAVIYSQSLKWGLGASAGQYSSVVATTKTNIEVDVVSYRQMDVRIGSESITRTGTTDTTGNLLLFAAGTSGDYTFPGRFYGDVVGTKNGAEVFHGVPCTNPNNVAGLYDLVSSSFFPSSSNVSFLAGLPLSCTPVDYIETDGDAYIDTGIIGNSPRSCELIVKLVRQTTSCVWLGARNSATIRYSLVLQWGEESASVNKNIGLQYNASSLNGISASQSVDNGTQIIIRSSTKPGEQVVSIKQQGDSGFSSVTAATTGAVTTGVNYYLFRNNYESNPYPVASGGRVYACKIYSDADFYNLVFDGVPCIYNGEYGLWNKVNSTFYGNANSSGAFTGPNA